MAHGHGQGNGELIAAQATHVRVLCHRVLPEQGGDRAQHVVTGGMAVAVVDVLEPIHVQQGQCRRFADFLVA
jgi:hypothetical protein